MEAPVKKKSPNQISLNSENHNTVETFLRDWKQYADDNGYDRPKKKDVINAMIRVAGELKVDDFFANYEKVAFCFTTTAAINGANQKIIASNYKMLVEYAEKNNIKPKPTQKDVFNYMLRMGASLTPNVFFQNKM